MPDRSPPKSQGERSADPTRPTTQLRTTNNLHRHFQNHSAQKHGIHNADAQYEQPRPQTLLECPSLGDCEHGTGNSVCYTFWARQNGSSGPWKSHLNSQRAGGWIGYSEVSDCYFAENECPKQHPTRRNGYRVHHWAHDQEINDQLVPPVAPKS